MDPQSNIEKIYLLALKNGNSLEHIYGMFQGMLQMYIQDNLPKEDRKEIERIITEIAKKLGK